MFLKINYLNNKMEHYQLPLPAEPPSLGLLGFKAAADRLVLGVLTCFESVCGENEVMSLIGAPAFVVIVPEYAPAINSAILSASSSSLE